ncbi:hypothetical protein SC499_16345 [Peribacillus simplex]|uniref:hypothetical protein n=1 Tax=Peribacillus simplex TaxID=1478 RepID=UPI00298EA604|nr:hypothetical protein [Peribacillus simplex]MDW7616254.1 hypothetical protein [Peribacillus simplex]
MGKGYKWTLLSILATSTFLTACGSSNNEKNIKGNDNVNTNSSTNNVVKTDNQNSEDNEGLNNMQDVRVKLTCNNEKVIVKLYDNPTSVTLQLETLLIFPLGEILLYFMGIMGFQMD